MAALIAIFLILFGTLVLYIRKQYNYWKDLGIPGPDPKFPYGTIVRSGNPVLNFKKHYETFKGKTPFCGLVNFITPTMLVTDPVLVKNILIRDFQYFNSRGIYYNEKDDPLSAHLFSVDGPKWKDLRTKLTPTFTSGKMKFMFNTIVAVSDQFKNVLADKVAIEKNTIEMKDLLARFTTDVIGTCAFGLECNSLVDPNAKFREMGLKFFNEPRHSLFGRVAITMMPGLSKFFHFKLIADDVSEFFMGAVQQTLEYRIKNNIQRNDFMDLLIKMYDETKTDDSNRGGLSFNEIAAQAWVFFLAGFETSSTAMSYALYELAQNQSIQEKARQDVLNALKKHENNFTYEAMQDMTYLEQCLNESLRKYPPVPILLRRAVKNYNESITGVTIREGQLAFIPVYAIHHDAEYYPDPEKYDPDRFTPEAIKKRDFYIFLPFGEGPRNCIGLRFGMMQAKIGLAMLLSNFKFKLNPKTPVPLTFKSDAFILASESGLYFDIERL